MRIYTNKPDQFPGLSLSHMTVAGRFWRSGEDKQQLPDRDYFVSQCEGDGPLCINIEHWKWDIRTNPIEVVDDSISKLKTVTQWATEAFPGRVIGHYSLFPLRDYWTPLGSKSDKWDEWRQANEYMTGLASMCHVTMPSLYTFYDDPDGWVKYAKANIEEARKYGKPVVPFLWSRYHNSNKTLALQGIGGDFWRVQLDTLESCGIQEAVIWDAASYFPTIGGEAWTEQTPWITTTKQWITEQ